METKKSNKKEFKAEDSDDEFEKQLAALEEKNKAQKEKVN